MAAPKWKSLRDSNNANESRWKSWKSLALEDTAVSLGKNPHSKGPLVESLRASLCPGEFCLRLRGRRIDATIRQQAGGSDQQQAPGYTPKSCKKILEALGFDPSILLVLRSEIPPDKERPSKYRPGHLHYVGSYCMSQAYASPMLRQP